LASKTEARQRFRRISTGVKVIEPSLTKKPRQGRRHSSYFPSDELDAFTADYFQATRTTTTDQADWRCFFRNAA
jgi:hypothetical protein